jgi:hypothetical protein
MTDVAMSHVRSAPAPVVSISGRSRACALGVLAAARKDVCSMISRDTDATAGSEDAVDTGASTQIRSE